MYEGEKYLYEEYENLEDDEKLDDLLEIDDDLPPKLAFKNLEF